MQNEQWWKLYNIKRFNFKVFVMKRHILYSKFCQLNIYMIQDTKLKEIFSILGLLKENIRYFGKFLFLNFLKFLFLYRPEISIRVLLYFLFNINLLFLVAIGILDQALSKVYYHLELEKSLIVPNVAYVSQFWKSHHKWTAPEA